MDILVVAGALVGIAIGAAIGWFIAGRPLAELRLRLADSEAQARERGEALARMTPELATMSERAARADALALALDQVRGEREGLLAELATMKANAANFEEQQRLLIEAKESLLKEFQNAGSAVLGKAQEAFLARADERFRQSEEKGEEKLKALLTPVGEKLASYERQVSELEAKRVDAFGQLHSLIGTMAAGQQMVRDEAMKLSSALTNAPKARGRWGEQALRNVLEQCGLAEHTDFHTEQSVDSDEGRQRPDAIVRIPGGKVLVIDAKVSLNAYQAAYHAETDEARAVAMKAHVASMKNHIQTLGTKGYQSQFSEAPDYVVMFVPGEHFVAAALESEPELWNFAFERKVLLATPTNLVAIARTVAQVWRQDALAAEARGIGELAGELYDRIAVAGEHLKRVGSGLESAVGNYNKFVGSFERNVQSSARKLRDKGIEIGKREVEEVPRIESAPRYNAADETLDIAGD